MSTPRRGSCSDERGQVLVIVAAGMLAMVAMVGLVIDGGYAWAQQRRTQNGADSVAKAGAVVIQYNLKDADRTDGDVGCAVEEAADANGVDLEEALYTDFNGAVLTPEVAVGPCDAGAGAAIPLGAQGVRAATKEDFDTFLAGVIGFSKLTARADATAVVAIQEGFVGGALPVTFPFTLDTCDGTNSRTIGEDEWQLLDPDALNAGNLVIVPLCTSGPGSVGWLDYECGQNLEQSVVDLCDLDIPIPAWLNTQPGNANNLETQLQAYHGDQPGQPEPDDAVMSVPIHDFTCRELDLADSEPIENCSTYPEWSANGNNLSYHIPGWAGFKLDGAYVGGDDPECNEAPGSPFVGGNGATGCLKGWFVDWQGPPGSMRTGAVNPGDDVNTGILLIN